MNKIERDIGCEIILQRPLSDFCWGKANGCQCSVECLNKCLCVIQLANISAPCRLAIPGHASPWNVIDSLPFGCPTKKWLKGSQMSVWAPWVLSVYVYTVNPSSVLYGDTIGFGYWYKAAHLVLIERGRLLQVPHRQDLHFSPSPSHKEACSQFIFPAWNAAGLLQTHRLAWKEALFHRMCAQRAGDKN